MKKIIVSLSILALVSMSYQGCKKKETAPEPVAPVVTDPYTYSSDLQSAKDISFANMTVSDIEMISSFICQNTYPSAYDGTTLPQGKITLQRDTNEKALSATFNNFVCVDGKQRYGSISVKYNDAASGAKVYYDFGYSAKITPVNYSVNGWNIKLYDPSKPLIVTNLVSPASYNPATTNLSWRIAGKLIFIHPTDSSRNIIWDGSLIKTLVNTKDPAIFATHKQSAIKWENAVVSYSGEISGFTTANVPFTMNITTTPLKRDFNCSFIPQGSTVITKYHPFINGIGIFNSSNFHPRTINYGPQEIGACDNTAVISFKDESHDFDQD